MEDESDAVINACEAEWDTYKSDCSGFVRAVASHLGIKLSGLANDLIDHFAHSAGWLDLGHDSLAATSRANLDYFVIGGTKGPRHGHVVVVVKSGRPTGYPVAYWGALNGTGFKKKTINYSWIHPELPKVRFFARKL